MKTGELWIARSLQKLSIKALYSKRWFPSIVPEDPNPDLVILNIVEKMEWEAIKVTAPQAASIEVKKTRFRDGLPNSGHELLIEVISQGLGDGEILLKDCIQV